jgi:hypothetical protein
MMIGESHVGNDLEEVVVAYFKVLSQHLPGRTKENQEIRTFFIWIYKSEDWPATPTGRLNISKGCIY